MSYILEKNYISDMLKNVFKTLLIKKVMDILPRIVFEYLAFFSKTKSYLNRLVKESINN